MYNTLPTQYYNIPLSHHTYTLTPPPPRHHYHHHQTTNMHHQSSSKQSMAPLLLLYTLKSASQDTSCAIFALRRPSVALQVVAEVSRLCLTSTVDTALPHVYCIHSSASRLLHTQLCLTSIAYTALPHVYSRHSFASRL